MTIQPSGFGGDLGQHQSNAIPSRDARMLGIPFAMNAVSRNQSRFRLPIILPQLLLRYSKQHKLKLAKYDADQFHPV